MGFWNMKRVLVICSLFLMMVAPAQAKKGLDASAGKNAFETCKGCHSTPNYSNVAPVFYVPKIGGQRKGYIASALIAYKHENRARTSMLANSENLTEEMAAAIGKYIEETAGKKRKAGNTSGDAKNGEKLAAACLGCHTNDLKDGMTAPILAGQHGNYLVKVMKDYQSGVRKDAVMQSMVGSFTEDELKDIAAYFADMKGLSIVK